MKGAKNLFTEMKSFKTKFQDDKREENKKLLQSREKSIKSRFKDWHVMWDLNITEWL
jgi:hypothetical protein